MNYSVKDAAGFHVDSPTVNHSVKDAAGFHVDSPTVNYSVKDATGFPSCLAYSGRSHSGDRRRRRSPSHDFPERSSQRASGRRLARQKKEEVSNFFLWYYGAPT